MTIQGITSRFAQNCTVKPMHEQLTCQATSGEQASNDTRTHPPGRPLLSVNLCGVYPNSVKREPKWMGARCRLRLVPRCCLTAYPSPGF